MDKKINVFIDTNVYLSFYYITDDDIAELRKLIPYLESGQVILWLPDQVKNEFWRNRDTKLHESLKKAEDIKFSHVFPSIIRYHEQYTQLRETLKKAGVMHGNILKSIREDVDSKELHSDSIIRELFQKSKKIPTNDEIFNSAQKRMALGNPPGKNDSLGDAINWESLLSFVDRESILYFITADSDYISKINKGKFNDFLYQEWKEKNGGEIIYKKLLSEFFKEVLPSITFAHDSAKNNAIEALEMSRNFSATHSAVANLEKYEDFNEEQIARLIDCVFSNNQVGWIITDSDVQSFYFSLITKHSEGIDCERLAKLKEALQVDTGSMICICSKCDYKGYSRFENVCPKCGFTSDEV